MKPRHASLAFAVAVCTALSSCAQTLTPSQRPEPATSRLPDELRAELALTPEQVHEIARLRKQLREQSAPVEARLDALRAEAARDMPPRRKPGLRDDASLGPQAEPLLLALREAEDRYRSALRRLLTDAQRAKLDRMEDGAPPHRTGS